MNTLSLIQLNIPPELAQIITALLMLMAPALLICSSYLCKSQLCWPEAPSLLLQRFDGSCLIYYCADTRWIKVNLSESFIQFLPELMEKIFQYIQCSYYFRKKKDLA